MINKILEKLKEYKRIIILAKKPSLEDYIEDLKISLIGIAIIGFIGFLILIIFAILLP